MRLTWDNGDRTVLVNAELGGVTFGWNLLHTAQDELFAAIEGTALHTRIIMQRMESGGIPVERIINAGGIPQRNDSLNQIYADVLNKPVLVPVGYADVAGFGHLCLPRRRNLQDHRRAQAAVCLGHKTFTPNPASVAIYEELFALYRSVYFALGTKNAEAVPLGGILPALRKLADKVRPASA